MKKTTNMVILAVLLLVTFIGGFGGKDGGDNASGQIAGLTVSNPTAMVKGYVDNSSLWLAYRVY